MADQRQGHGRPNSNRRGRGRSGGGNNNRRQNPLSRNIDSNGPEIKVRGNIVNVLEKYQSLARDAQAMGEHIAEENYLQHAEHYHRLMNEYQQQQQQQQQRGTQDQQRNDQKGGDSVRDAQTDSAGEPQNGARVLESEDSEAIIVDEIAAPEPDGESTVKSEPVAEEAEPAEEMAEEAEAPKKRTRKKAAAKKDADEPPAVAEAQEEPDADHVSA